MLQHREQEQSTPRLQASGSTVRATEVETPPEKQSRWRELYNEYVTDNPVYWKESNRPDISSLSPKLRAKALANREKREAEGKPAWRNLLEAVFYLVCVAAVLSAIGQAIQYNSNTRIPLAALCISPMLGLMGTASALTRNIILEREKRTWNALLLSHLTPAQILLGKLLPWLKQLAWVMVSAMVFVVPGLWQGNIPWLALVIAVPLLLTAPLPGSIYGLHAGLHAESMAKGMSQINRRVVWPLLVNMLAAGAGTVGMLALKRLEYNPLPSWLAMLLLVPWLMAVANLAWTRRLWRGLLRDFHKAPADFSG